MNNILNDLRDIRRASMLTQTEVGDIAGFSRINISRWERGYCVPTINSVSKIAEALGYEIILRRK